MSTIVNRRRVMGNNGLPYDAEIEYLESNGTLWIDTNVACSTSNIIRATMLANGPQKNNNAYAFFGQGISYTDSNIELFSSMLLNKISGCIKGNSDVELDYTNLFNVELKDKIFTFTDGTGTTLATANRSSAPDYTAANTMAIFALNRPSLYIRPNEVRCYKFSILNNGVYILDLIPVRVGQVGYMYDKVSKQLFGNAGTGDFILGPDKYDAEIEYLESTGTLYIDTGLVHQVQNYEYYIDFTPNQTEGKTAVFGSSNNGYWDGISYGNTLYIGNRGQGNGFYRVANTRQTIRMVVADNHVTVYKDGNITSDIDFTGSIISGRHILLYAYTFGSDNPAGKSSQKVYSFSLIMNGVKVLDFIPVRVGQVGYMYDKVSGRLFGNAGTGDFILGPDKS